jgi:hypothetical protein
MAGSPLMLPDGLANFLNELGFIWPKSDEVRMAELGSAWVDFGSQAGDLHGNSGRPVQSVVTQNKGLDIDAFTKAWQDRDRGAEVLKDGSQGAMLVGPGMFIAAAVVLALKIAVIVQLTLLAVQIATALASAVPTFGASLAWIPVAKKLASLAINYAISQAVTAILG